MIILRHYWLKLLFAAILSLSILASQAKELLVGTTGDYPPLTYIKNGKYVGSEINLIQQFAKSKAYQLKWVATSWPTLSNDLINHKFQVAVGGISLTPARESALYVSKPVNYTAKAPLILCSNLTRFNSWASIDNESVLVVENRGGTNQQFALDNIKQANILLISKNYTALDSISNKLADVMFTDDVEINYRHQINPKLCLAKINQSFLKTAKVFLFEKTATGTRLQQEFNHWLNSNSSSIN